MKTYVYKNIISHWSSTANLYYAEIYILQFNYKIKSEICQTVQVYLKLQI